MARVWCMQHIIIVSHEAMLRFSLVTPSWGVLNGVRTTALRCDSAVIKGTRLKWVASLYVHGARFGARVPSLVRVAEPLLLWLHYCHAMQRYLNTRHVPRTVQKST